MEMDNLLRCKAQLITQMYHLTPMILERFALPPLPQPIPLQVIHVFMYRSKSYVT